MSNHAAIAAFFLFLCIGLADARAQPQPLVIAPDIDGLPFCQKAIDLGIMDEQAAIKQCAAANQNSASRIQAALDKIGPALSPSGHFALGYTLSLPLLGFYDRQNTGWVLDQHRIDLAVQTIADIDRPVVVYASANHFGSDADPALLKALAADPLNLMSTQAGPLKPDNYFGVPVYAWSLARPDSRVEQMNHAALSAVLGAICRLDGKARQRIVAFSLLGETHQMWPDFFSGMGYSQDPGFTDYSAASTDQFHQWLANRFDGQIGRLNAAVNGNYWTFDDVTPPWKDIQNQKLDHYLEENEAYSDGILPIFGWAHQADGKPVYISIYLNGSPIGSVLADMNRMDVLQAIPAIGTPNVGWRYDFDYSALPPGSYTLEVFATASNAAPVRVAVKYISVIDRKQSKLAILPGNVGRPAGELSPGAGLRVSVDSPGVMTPLFYNPVARLWDAFRNYQVEAYIEGYAADAARSCLPQGSVFEYQMIPSLYTSWDPVRMAVDASLLPNPHYQLGVTLYGGAAYGDPFFRWLSQYPRSTYGVEEMNPMVALPEQDMVAMLERHRQAGARFVAPYILSILPPNMLRVGGLSGYRIEPKTPENGSAAFYAALQDVMQH